MDNTLSSIIFKHGDNDYSLWTPDLSEDDIKKFIVFIEEYINNGHSIRGSKEDIIEELERDL